MRFVLTVLLAALAVPVGACASQDPGTRGLGPFYRGDYEQAEQIFRDAAETGPPSNAVLNRCRAASAALARGDDATALRDLLDAYPAMEDLSSTAGEQTAAVLGQESSKVWKGEPHERAMASYYTGLCFLRKGDRGNALAGFKNALIIDSATGDEAYDSDVPLWHVLSGRVRQRWGRPEQAAKDFAEAARLAPKNPYVTEAANRDANVVIVADLGIGPVRYATGPHGSVSAYRGSAYPDHGARVSVDGAVAGLVSPALDVLREATTRGGREFEGILAGKAIFKDVSTAAGVVVMATAEKWEQVAAGAGLVMLGQLLSARTDTRAWETLPGEVHLWVGRVEPGVEHTIRVEFVASDGKPVSGFRTYEARVRVEEGAEVVLYARSGPSRPVINPPEARESRP